MRALVTGSTGFTGAHVLAVLSARGISVVRVSRCAGPELRQIEMTSAREWAELLRDTAPELVLHLSQGKGAAAALLDGAATARSAASILLVGSAAEYGPVALADLPVTEDHPAAPSTAYGRAKHAQTLLGLAAAGRGQRVVIARTANLVGPGAPADSALGSFARQIVEVERGARSAVETGPLDATRDFVDVRDAARAYVELVLARAAAGSVVHVASGKATRIRDALALLLAAAGAHCEVREDGARDGGVPAFSASPARLRALIGSEPWIPLERSALDMIAWARAQR